MTAALCGGTIDHMMMRLAEMIYCLPYLLFVILITVIIGPGFAPIIASMVIIGWIQMARITRSLVIGIKQTEYYRAADPWVSVAVASSCAIFSKHLGARYLYCHA